MTKSIQQQINVIEAAIFQEQFDYDILMEVANECLDKGNLDGAHMGFADAQSILRTIDTWVSVLESIEIKAVMELKYEKSKLKQALWASADHVRDVLTDLTEMTHNGL